MSNDEEKEIALPRARDVIEEVASKENGVAKEQENSEKAYLRKFNENAVEKEASYIHLKGLADHYQHKGKWSYFLMLLLLGMMVFQWVLLRNVGTKAWDFSEYEWLLPILLVQNLGQIIGLAFVVVKSLFK